MKEPINSEIIDETLQKIGYRIRGTYPNAYIIDHKGENTGYRVLRDHIEYNDHPRSLSMATCFHFREASCELLDSGDAVSIGTKECFVLFMNHDKSRSDSSPS